MYTRVLWEKKKQSMNNDSSMFVLDNFARAKLTFDGVECFSILLQCILHSVP